MNHSYRFTSLTTAEFKWLRKGLTVLMSYGVEYDQALDLLLTRLESRREHADKLRRVRRTA